VYQQLAHKLSLCDTTFVPTLPTSPKPGQVVFAGEGPSDAMHLSRAFRALAKDFKDLHFVKEAHKPPKGDQALWNWLEARKHSHNSHPVVGIFDCDSNQFVQRIGAQGWIHLGNGVVAVLLARPTWLREGEPFCIEMLHERSTLSRSDADGRRIFLRAEFGDDDMTADGKYRARHPQGRTLVVEDVDRVADGASVGLGKVAFAQGVSGRTAPFQFVSFEGFRPTLERLWAAVAEAQTACS
jgi:hypothetical protein